MRNYFIAAAVIWGGLAASGAQAMPLAVPAVSTEKATFLQVDYPCGRGWHETPSGDCRPNGWRRGPPPRRDWDGPPPRHRHHWDDDRPAYDGWRRPPPPRW